MKEKQKIKAEKLRNSLRKQRGITLIALIVTIIILIILATISINIIFGNEGLIKRAEQAKELHEQGASGESEMLNQTDEYLWQKIEKEPKPEVEYTNVYATLYEDGILGFSNNEEKIEGLTPVEGKTWNITDEEYSCEWKSDEEIIATTPWFGDRENIEKITFTNEIVPKNVAYLFIGLTNLNTIEKIENFNVTKTNSLFYTFAYCSNVTSIDLSKFNTSSITNMMGLFAYCNNLTTIKFGGKFDTSNVTNMANMFRNCSALKSIDLSELDKYENIVGVYDIDDYDIDVKLIHSICDTFKEHGDFFVPVMEYLKKIGLTNMRVEHKEQELNPMITEAVITLVIWEMYYKEMNK